MRENMKASTEDQLNEEELIGQVSAILVDESVN